MKKLNNNGVITRGMVLLAALILVVVITVIIIIKVNTAKSDDKYKEFEEEMVSAAQNYYIIKNVDVEEGEEKRITLKQLVNSNLVYNELKDKCNGYVILSNEKDIATDEYDLVYTAYIECGSRYMSANYSKY